MLQSEFPAMPLDSWRATRDTITTYSKVIGKIRRALTPKQKHWWHISLRATATGLTTTPIPTGADALPHTFEMQLDFTRHELRITNSLGGVAHVALHGQSAADFCRESLHALAGMGIHPNIDESQFSDTTPGTYDQGAVGRFWKAFSQIDSILKEFKGTLRRETGPVQLWPHHFDHAFLWFSGRLVPGYDPENEEYADEQMNFGFSTGDGSINDAYFYITAYPWPDGLEQTPLPEGAYWHTDGWKGGILPYDVLVGADNAKGTLLAYMQAAHQAGKALMKF